MLEYYHSYNTEDVDKPYNIACIASDASNVALYVNDEFKTTLQPNVSSSGISYPISYKQMPSNNLLAKLLIKSTLEANYDLNNRKSIFNDKNYCQIVYDITKPTDADHIALEVNSSCENNWHTDGEYDYYVFKITNPDNYQIKLTSSYYYYRDMDLLGVVTEYAYAYTGYNDNLVINRFLPAGTYTIRCRCYFTYDSNPSYTISLVKSGQAVSKVIPAYISRYYLTNNNGVLSFSSDKASKFYFDPKVFNLKDLYIKLFGSLPLDTKLNSLYLSSQQQAIINTKVVSLGQGIGLSDSIILDLIANYSTAKLEDDIFSNTGLQGSIKLSSVYSLDNFASYGDKIRLVSNKETLEFDYLPFNASSYNITSALPSTTTSKILHIGIETKGPNKRILLSYALVKGTQTINVNYKVSNDFTIEFSHTITRL